MKRLIILMLICSTINAQKVTVQLNPARIEWVATYNTETRTLSKPRAQLRRTSKKIVEKRTCGTCAPVPAEVYLGSYVTKPAKPGVYGSGQRVDLCYGSCTVPEEESTHEPVRATGMAVGMAAPR